MTRRLLPLLCLILCVLPALGADVETTGDDHVLELTGPRDQVSPPWTPVRPLYGNTDYMPMLRKFLESTDPFERSRGAFLLGLGGDRTSAARIATLLKDPDRTVRASSGLALGFLGDTRGIHACDAVLKADLDWMRYYAVYALWYMNSARARAVLSRNLAYQSDFISGVIREALRAPFEAARGRWSSKPTFSEKTTLEDLWTALCNEFILESDHWWHRGRYEQTIRCEEVVIFLDPTYTDGYSLVAWLQWSMGDDAAAIRTLNRGIQALPDNPETWGALGQHYWTTKRYALALEPLRKALELGGDHAVRLYYASSLEKLGRLDEALTQWEQIVKESPEDPAAPMNVDRLRKKIADQNTGR